MTKLRNILAIGILAVGAAFGQLNSFTRTTTSSAVAITDSTVRLTSATGVTANTTALWIDGEFMPVIALSGTTARVLRGQGGVSAGAHASGAAVWIGNNSWFNSGAPPSGVCTLANLLVHPWINVSSNTVYSCYNSTWQLGTITNVGTAATGVKAFELGNGRNHVTRLEFSGITVGAAVGAANLAFGVLLYTMPAGAIVTGAENISIALAGSGSTCDADTPDGGLGTTVASGANATLDANAAFENLLTGQTFNDLSGTVEVKTVNTALAVEAADNHTVYFNLADGWAGACTVTATGSATVSWVFLP